MYSTSAVKPKNWKFPERIEIAGDSRGHRFVRPFNGLSNADMQKSGYLIETYIRERDHKEALRINREAQVRIIKHKNLSIRLLRVAFILACVASSILIWFLSFLYLAC